VVAGGTPGGASSTPNVNIAGANIISSEFTISGLPSVSVNKVPFSVPVPKPPVNVEELAKLEVYELRAMEGEERMAIARRIAYLRDVRSMCDATLTMMSQYQSVMGPDVKIDENENKKSGDEGKKSEPEIIEKSSPKTVSASKNKSENKSENNSENNSEIKTDNKLENEPNSEKSSPKTEPKTQTEPKIEAEPVFEETENTEAPENPESTSETVCDSTNKTEPTETTNSDANELRRRRIQALSQSQ